VSGTIVWFTGLPASGKSTLAELVRVRLGETGRCAVVLDGDAVRDAIGAGAYDAEGRDRFYRTLANLAALVARQAVVVLVPATAPRRAHRDYARATDCRLIEVWVKTPVEACEARDRKGLYAAARRDPATTLPGIGVPYEAPEAPDVVADGGRDRTAAQLVAHLVRS
jgi:adenylylsulfate kinase